MYLQYPFTCNQKASYSDRKWFHVVFRNSSFSEFDDINVFDQKILVFIAYRYNFSIQFDFVSTNNHNLFSRNFLFIVVSKTFVQCSVFFTGHTINGNLTAKIIDRIKNAFHVLYRSHCIECVKEHVQSITTYIDHDHYAFSEVYSLIAMRICWYY